MIQFCVLRSEMPLRSVSLKVALTQFAIKRQETEEEQSTKTTRNQLNHMKPVGYE